MTFLCLLFLVNIKKNISEQQVGKRRHLTKKSSTLNYLNFTLLNKRKGQTDEKIYA
jgi:hypothetical protein